MESYIKLHAKDVILMAEALIDRIDNYPTIPTDYSYVDVGLDMAMAYIKQKEYIDIMTTRHKAIDLRNFASYALYKQELVHLTVEDFNLLQSYDGPWQRKEEGYEDEEV